MGRRNRPHRQKVPQPRQTTGDVSQTNRQGDAVTVAKWGLLQGVLVALITTAGTVSGYYFGKYQAQKDAPGYIVSSGKNKNVIMLGSGTVFKYLQAHRVAGGLSDPNRLNVPILEGPTETAAELFGSASEANSVLLMAANSLDIYALRPRAEGQRGSKPEYVFEVFLGADPLHLLLVTAGGGDAVVRLKRDFGNILAFSRKDTLDFKNICRIENWLGGPYNFYAGSVHGGTTALWRKTLGGLGCNAWPPKPLYWDIQDIYDITRYNEPRIYFGSKVLSQAHIKSLKDAGIVHSDLQMFNGSESAKRGLYLYGAIDPRDVEKQFNGEVYRLPAKVTQVLRFIFDSLEQSPNDILPRLIEPECINLQRQYFHLLDSDPGWIDKTLTPPDRNIYRVAQCPGRPE